MNETNQLARLREIPAPLLAWYDRVKRSLPWRELPTPYRVWISEIMLQQTRVEAVKPYFERFVADIPDIPALAAVEDAILLKHWEGLGYYSRARNLKKAALQAMERFDGQLPADYPQLLSLTGIGEYTAGAIGSIAFGLPTPAVDGNVLRVTARLLADETDILSPALKKLRRQQLLSVLEELSRPGDFNQALMELGACVCIPNGAPLCERCPVSHLCEGVKTGIAAALPKKSPKKSRKMQQMTVAIVTYQAETLRHHRPETGLLAGLWEFPHTEGFLSQSEVGAWLSSLGLSPARLWQAGEATHIFTHIEWKMRVYRATLAAPPALPDSNYRMVGEDEEDAPMPTAFSKLLAL